MKSRAFAASFRLAPLLVLSGLLSIVHPEVSSANPDPVAIEQPSIESALVGRTWQLVRIMSMDDTESVPDDRSHYRLRLEADGAVQVRADCNRAFGKWTSEQPGKLEFGPLAATNAQCPPGSLHDSYLTQFPWVRSYVTKDGKLFLATMADGSIIEFEPVALPLAATVLGEEVRTEDAREMQDIILSRLFDRYADERDIRATDLEIDTYVEKTRRGMRAKGLTAEDTLTTEEAAQVDQMRRDMGRSMIRQWKLNRALHEEFGGRIIFQQFGPEPIDAYRRYLGGRQAAGDFTIHDATFETAFWDYFTNDSKHDFYEPGSADEAVAFATPPWEVPTAGASDASAKPGSRDGIPLPPDEGGPLNWQVTDVTAGLRLRSAPSTSAEILTTYPLGTVLDNLGCRRAEDRVWCDVQQLGGGPRGFVAAAYLKPAISPNGAAVMGPDTSSLRAGQGDFDATGSIPCAQNVGQPMSECRFGVARTGGGYATVVVTKPDGARRAIFFRMGIPIGADTSQADGYGAFRATKESDLHRISVGEERYEMPDAVVLGG
ncbi:MAG: META domain-containing protein [Sedimenticolaceae bacterium]